MMATDAIRNLIRRGEDHQLRSQISIGRAEGHDDDGAKPGGVSARRQDHAGDGAWRIAFARKICGSICDRR